MERVTKRGDAAVLELHPAVDNLHEVLSFSPRSSEPVGIVGGVAVTNVGVLIAAQDSGRKSVIVVELTDLASEDPAVIAGKAVKDALGGCTDPLILGMAWASFNAFCKSADRPRKGYKKYRYVRQFGISPSARLSDVVRDTFGVSEDQLRRYARLQELPVELHRAFTDKEIRLQPLLELVEQPFEVVEGVVRSMKKGIPAAEAIAKHMSRESPPPAPRTALRRMLRAGSRATSVLTDRSDVLMYLTDEERHGLTTIQTLVDELLQLPTKGQALAEVFEAVSRARNRGIQSKNGDVSEREVAETISRRQAI